MRVVRWRMADGGWQLAMAAAVVVIVVVVLVVVAVVVVGAGVFGIGAKRGAAGRECLRFWAEGLEYVEAGYVRHGAAVDGQVGKGAKGGFSIFWRQRIVAPGRMFVRQRIVLARLTCQPSASRPSRKALLVISSPVQS